MSDNEPDHPKRDCPWKCKYCACMEAKVEQLRTALEEIIKFGKDRYGHLPEWVNIARRALEGKE